MGLQIQDCRFALRAQRLLRAGIVGAFSGALICGSAAMAQEANTGSAHAKPKKATHGVNSKKVVKAKKYVPGGPVYKDAPAVAAPIPACSQASAYEVNKLVGMKGWAIPPNNAGDSILLDYGCWRTNLAKYGIGVIGSTSSTLRTNLLNHYTPPTTQQQYAGQRPTGNVNAGMTVTYDLSRWGLPDGQFAITGGSQNTNWTPNWGLNTLTMQEMKIYGTAFNKALEYEVGYVQTFLRFQGFFVGGNTNNPLGASGGSAAQVGSNLTPQVTPAALFKWNITDKWYDRFGIQRSLPGSVATRGAVGNMISAEHYGNPTGFSFADRHPCKFGICYNSPRELFIDEIGYQTRATPDNLSTWVRLTGYYNTTPYRDYASPTGGNTKDNYAVTLYADQQLWQLEPGAYTSYKGLYIGGTVAYNDPHAASLSQTYEFRVYTYGMFGRPKDQIAFNFQHAVVSHYLADSTNAGSLCANNANILCMRNALNTYSLTYTANIMSGVFVTMGAQYIDHPALAWSPKCSTGYGSKGGCTIPALGGADFSGYNINHALNFVASLYTVF
jgi:porin